jgi:hypothetical protein
VIANFDMNNIALRNTIYIAFLVAVVGALYGQFLWNPIVFDDIYFFLLDNAGTQPVSNYQWEWLQLRSLPYATLAWTKAWFGLSLINFRVGNLILHAGVCVALYGFLGTLFSATEATNDTGANPAVKTDRLSPNTTAFVAALLFAVHPVATYATGYLVQRTILLATLFCLLAMWAWVLGSFKRRSYWLWLCVPLYYLAVFSKEHAIMLVVVLPLLTVVLHADWRQRLQQQAAVLACLALIALFVLLAKKGILGSVYEINAGEMLGSTDGALSYPLSVLTQLGLFFKYAFLWLLPRPGWMSIDMREPFATMTSPFYWFGALAFLGWGITGFWLIFKRGHMLLFGFSMLFPWLMFMTEFTTVRIQEIFVLYRSYLWAGGALCAMPLVLERLSARTSIAISIVCASLLFLFSMERLVTMSHPMLLWEDAKKLLAGRNELPGAARIYYNLGTEYINVDRPDKAIPELKQAIAVSPDFSEAHGNLGVAYFKLGEWTVAATSFGEAIDIEVKNSKVPGVKHLLGRAQSYEKSGEILMSQNDYREICRLYKRSCDKVH